MSKSIIESLNLLLADANVFARKVKHYHWDVKGPNFFTLHAQFEAIYDQWAEFADVIAERVVALGGKPLPTSADDLKHTRLKEDPSIPGGDAMVANVVADLTALGKSVQEAHGIAESAGDDTTVDLLDDVRDGIDSKLWMLKAYLG